MFGEQNIQHRFHPFKVGVLTLLFPSGSSNIDIMLPGGVGVESFLLPLKAYKLFLVKSVSANFVADCTLQLYTARYSQLRESSMLLIGSQ